MKILYLTKYTRKGASSRLRHFQYFPCLEENGMQVDVKPLFSDTYLSNLYQGKSVLSEVLKGYLKRLFHLLTVGKYNVVVLEYELFPYFPAVFEEMLKFFGIKYIVDYDDAIFHNYDSHNSQLIRNLLGGKIKHVMRNSSAVVAGNRYLADYARKAGAAKVEIIPTVVDTERYRVKDFGNKDSEKPLMVGWIGTMSTFKYVKQILPLLEEVNTNYPLELYIIGAQEMIASELNIHFIPWSEQTEAESISQLDVGIMPLEDTLWEKGKCGYKLIQYMACGLPTIAAGIGANNEIVKHGVTGFLANNDDEWRNAVIFYAKNRAVLPEMGKKGKQIMEQQYSLQSMQKKLLNVIYEFAV